ncbi:Os02g0170900, partial [Oryza sativa Japonica Group]
CIPNGNTRLSLSLSLSLSPLLPFPLSLSSIPHSTNARTNPPFPPKTKSPVDARGIQSSESSPNPARRSTDTIAN